MAKEIKLTQESLDAYKEELEYLKTTRADEVAEQLKEARSFGDLSENAEYDLARDEQAKMEREISDLENMLHNAEIIENVRTDSVGVGNTVSFSMDGKEYIEYQIVGSQDSDPVNRKISNDSPIGRALLGHKSGDEFKAEIKVGAHVTRRDFKIIAIH